MCNFCNFFSSGGVPPSVGFFQVPKSHRETDVCTLALVSAVEKSIVAYAALDPHAASLEQPLKVLWLQLFDSIIYPGPVNFELLVFPRHGLTLRSSYMVLRFLPVDLMRFDGLLPLLELFSIVHISRKLTDRLGWALQPLPRRQISCLHLVHCDDILRWLRNTFQGICRIFASSPYPPYALLRRRTPLLADVWRPTADDSWRLLGNRNDS